MKSILKFVILIAPLLASCDSQREIAGEEISLIPIERVDIELNRVEQAIVVKQNEFSCNFFKNTLENSIVNNRKFVLASPISASMALSLLANGAAGETQKEILNALGFKNADMDAVNTFNFRLCDELKKVDNTVSLSLANSLWFDTDFKVKQSFIDDNVSSYGAEIFVEELASPETFIKINEWCSNKTNGLIPHFLDEPFSSASDFALFNATYFLGKWNVPFEKSKTKKQTFYSSNGEKSKVEMMNGELKTAYSEKNGVSIVSLPYGNRAFEMLLLAAGEKGDVLDFMSNMKPEDLYIGGSYNVTLTIPKFDMDFKTVINNTLRDLGICTLYDEEARDLSGISDSKVRLEKLAQQTRIIVDESGTEAAAVTGSYSWSSPGPDYIPPKPVVVVDKPFGFVIRETSTKTILFMAYVGVLDAPKMKETYI